MSLNEEEFEKELVEGSQALVNWLDSQHIEPKLALSILGHVSAAMFTKVSAPHKRDMHIQIWCRTIQLVALVMSHVETPKAS